MRAFDAILVLGPEHARVFADAGWDRERIIFELHLRLTTPIGELLRGAGDIEEGIPASSVGAFLAPDTSGAPVALPKFSPTGLMLAYAGGGAGLFSMIIPGWINGDTGSKPVTRAVQY